MRIKQAVFIKSVASADNLPEGDVPEIAIAGKSNVGKSSLINALTNNGKLAKTSGAPGRTRLLNYFSINNDEFRLVDLPGYGFAKVSDDEKNKWASMIEGYFNVSRNLKHVLVLVDIRHEPNAYDKQMIAYLHHYMIPFSLIATKCDKLSRAQCMKQRSVIAAALAQGSDNIILTSASKKTGTEAICEEIEKVIELNKV